MLQKNGAVDNKHASFDYSTIASTKAKPTIIISLFYKLDGVFGVA